MALRRYNRTPVLKFGEKYGTSEAILAIRNNINNGNIRKKIYICEENVRLDILAGQEYGDGKLWWILAACSGIGWGLHYYSKIRRHIQIYWLIIKYDNQN